MNDRQIDSAQRFFNLAVQNNFYKGRKLNTLAAACLYCVCREEKTSHMLIDFSDALSVRNLILTLAIPFRTQLNSSRHLDQRLSDWCNFSQTRTNLTS